MSDWFTDDMRGQDVSYGIRWGTTRAHLTRITIDGPGAVSVHALCHGIQRVSIVDSSLDVSDEDRCRDFLNEHTRIERGESLYILGPSERRALCPRCKARFEKEATS